MSAVHLNAEVNDSTISTSQNHDAMKKRKKRKHKASGDDQPADVQGITTTAVDGMPSEEKIKHKKKKRDRSSEKNDSIIEPSQSDSVESKNKQHKSTSEEKPLKEAEIEIEEAQDKGNDATSQEKKKEKKKKRDRSSEKHESVIEHSQPDVTENKRKRRKSQIEEEPQKATEVEPEQDQDSVIERTQESKRKRHKTYEGEEVPKVTAKESEQDPKFNGVEEGGEKVIRKSNRRTVAEKPVSSSGDKKKLAVVSAAASSGDKKKPAVVSAAAASGDKKKPAAGKKSRSAGVEGKVTATDKSAAASSADQNNGTPSVDKADSTKMTDQDQQMLLSRMLSILPEYDGVSYLQRLEELDWNLVTFGGFSTKTCQKLFSKLVAKIRRSRTLAEIIHDAQRSGVCVTSSTKTTPAKPLKKFTALQLYLMKKVDAYLQKHPKIKREDAREKYRSKWAELSDEEKVKYIRKAEDLNAKYQEEVEEKCRSDPSYKPPKRLAKLSKEEQKILDKVDGIPAKPPGSGYLMFCEIMKERLKAEIPDISSKNLMTEFGHRWLALTKEKREHYRRKAEKKKHQYQEFLEAHPSIEAKLNADKRGKVIIKRAAKQIFAGEPVKPPNSGYMLLCKEVLPTLTDLASRDRMQEASRRWAALPEAKKTEYNDKVKAAMEHYLVELNSFKEKLSPEDLVKYEEIHKKASPRTPKKSSSDPKSDPNKEIKSDPNKEIKSDPKKEITGKRKRSSSSEDNEEAVGKRRKAASKKAKRKSEPMVVKLWSKSPTPNRKSVTNKKTEDNAHENESDTSSEAF